MKESWKNNNLLEKKRNSDYEKFIKLYFSKDPLYCFAMISASRGLPLKDDAGNLIKYTQHQIDSNNRKNSIRASYLEDQLLANYFGVMEVTGYYTEEEAGKVEETSYLVYTTIGNFNKLETVVTYLGKKYHQDSVLFIKNKQIYLTVYRWSEDGNTCLGTKKRILGEIDFKNSNSEEIFSQLGTKKAGRSFRITEFKKLDLYRGYLNHVRLNGYLYLIYSRFYEKNYLSKVDEAFKELEESLES